MKEEKQQQGKQQQENKPKEEPNEIKKKQVHPTACLFQFIFKVLSILCYLLLNSAEDSSVLTFIIVMMLTCFDFWTVKNVTGRFLVGMRWWSEIDKKTGKEVWLFESQTIFEENNDVDYYVFWTSQAGVIVFYFIMFLVNLVLFDFFWVLLNFVCCFLSLANFLGFYRCRGQHQKKIKEMVAKLGIKAVQGQM